MTKEQYLCTIQYFKQHPSHKKVLLLTSKITPLIFFISYIVFIIFVYFNQPDFIFKTISIPAGAFISNTLLRKYINAPRPFEIYEFQPLKKHRPGQSFPSRHCTSAMVIACTFTYVHLYLGILFIFGALLIGLTRILTGVHFIKDVFGGYAIGILFALFYFI